jgi:nucleoside-diphosphate-sugar epimerase
MRVLITGGLGYLGSVISEHLLNAGHSVLVLDNLMYGGQSLFHLCARDGFDFVRGDARDDDALRAALKRADVIIPLAALVGAPACDRDPWVAQSVNYGAIKQLNELRSANQLVLYPCTNSGYGAKSGDVFCTEETPMEPISLYGRTKVEAEKLLLDSDNVITLRLATVFGASPRMRLDLLVNHFTHAAFTDGCIEIFEKDAKRNYVHIRDVADCFVHCLANTDAMLGRPYNLGLDDANLSKEELALKVREHVGAFRIYFAEVGEDPDKRDYIVSNERLRGAGFGARRTLDDGIVELLKAFRMIGRSELGNV